VTPSTYYVGDGVLWVVWREGGAGLVAQTSQDFKPMLATVVAGMLTSRSMMVRYADGASCTAVPVAMVGLWLR
jgi:hypothetical protein